MARKKVEEVIEEESSASSNISSVEDFKSTPEVRKKIISELKNKGLKNVNENVDYTTYSNFYNLIKNNVELNKKEILFFEMLIQHKNSVLTRDMFLAYVYEYETMSDSALNNFIMRIRRRFGKTFLHTIPDVGYKMIV